MKKELKSVRDVVLKVSDRRWNQVRHQVYNKVKNQVKNQVKNHI